MFRMFIGMIIGAMMAIYAADGPATADQILSNSESLLMGGSQPFSSLSLIIYLIGGGIIWRLLQKRKLWKPFSLGRQSHESSKPNKN